MKTSELVKMLKAAMGNSWPVTASYLAHMKDTVFLKQYLIS
jgi:hypothetical protein